MGWFFGNGVKKGLLDRRFARIPNINPELVAKFRQFCLRATKKELASIDVKVLSQKWDASKREVIGLFLHAAKAGILSFDYIVQCDHCKGRGNAPGLKEIRSEMVCAGCKMHTHPGMDNTVEIRFKLNPDLARLPAVTGAGLKAIEVVNTDEFRTLFETERPLPGEHLPVSELALLFTDLSGSTATYERLGDGKAYRIVREHFVILFDLVKKHNGGVIKTIGDSVMATFLNPADAVACALETRQAFERFNKRKDVQGAANLKMGAHSGPCLAVTLNQRLDFFGSTVNKASRIQGVAKKNEICISSELAEKTRSVFAGRKAEKSKLLLKGIAKPVEIISIRR